MSNTSEVFLGEIRLFGHDWAPDGWALCDGSALKIADHAELYAIIGTKFGGDGTTTFCVPDLRDRAPVGAGPSSSSGLIYRVGDKGGALSVSLEEAHLPAHSHQLLGNSGSGSSADPAGKMFARERMGRDVYRAPGDQPVAMTADAIGPGGVGQAHDNVMPSLGLTACIAVKGVFPIREE